MDFKSGGNSTFFLECCHGFQMFYSFLHILDFLQRLWTSWMVLEFWGIFAYYIYYLHVKAS